MLLDLVLVLAIVIEISLLSAAICFWYKSQQSNVTIRHAQHWNMLFNGICTKYCLNKPQVMQLAKVMKKQYGQFTIPQMVSISHILMCIDKPKKDSILNRVNPSQN